MILDRFLEYVNSDLNQPVGLGPTSLYNDDWKILVGWNYLKNSTFWVGDPLRFAQKTVEFQMSKQGGVSSGGIWNAFVAKAGSGWMV